MIALPVTEALRRRFPNAFRYYRIFYNVFAAGILSAVRHPWYTGGMLIVWARPLDTAAVMTNLVVCGYFVAGAYLEERKLKVQFGEAYRDYQRQVSMFFPFKWVRKKRPSPKNG